MRHALLLFLSLAGAAPAAAEVTRLEILSRAPYEGGRSFPGVGAYERLRGRVHFAVRPDREGNQTVVDLEFAPRAANGTVAFSADLELYAPVDRSRANGTLLYDVNNRGGLTAPGMFNTGADHFLMRQGYVLVGSGWIGELLPGSNRLRLDAPTATRQGVPITGLVRMEMAPDAPATRLSVTHWANHAAPRPTTEGRKAASLTWRLREKDPRVSIPRRTWKLEVTPVEEGAGESRQVRVEVVLPGGFQPGHLYELMYEAEGPLIQGLGLAGIRDLVSFLRHSRSPMNPLRLPTGRPVITHTLGFGTSQSGRCLRQFLYDGFNADEEGRRVFDGLFPHVAGAGLGFFNHRFASPTRHNAQHDNHLYPADQFPFTYGEEKDPFTGRVDGLLRRARASGTVPKLFHTQTSAEYWHRAGSLVHTDPTGSRDAEIPAEVRIYAIGGAQHGAGSGIPPASAGRGRLPGNPTDYRPLLRALLTALNRWVRDRGAPPPSVYPRLADGTLSGWRAGETGWRPLPGIPYPEVIQQPEFLDHGPEFLTHRRITRLPPRSRGTYGVRVPAVDALNNDRGMLQAPTVAVPVGTFTGWNLRAPELGAETELLSLAGSYLPLSPDRARRSAAGDPRSSLEELYSGFATYERAFQGAARLLVERGYLLDEDLPRLRELARAHRPLFVVP